MATYAISLVTKSIEFPRWEPSIRLTHISICGARMCGRPGAEPHSRAAAGWPKICYFRPMASTLDPLRKTEAIADWKHRCVNSAAGLRLRRTLSAQSVRLVPVQLNEITRLLCGNPRADFHGFRADRCPVVRRQHEDGKFNPVGLQKNHRKWLLRESACVSVRNRMSTFGVTHSSASSPNARANATLDRSLPL